MKQFKLLSYIVIAMFIFGVVSAEEMHDFSAAKNIIDNKVPCSELSQGDLEELGDYYMEQMHPGDAHEVMDQMMGGEGSESLQRMHINMGLRFYCGDESATGNSMMGSGMMMGGGNGMMGGGNYYQPSSSMWNTSPLGSLFNGWLVWLLLIGLIIFLVVSLVNKKDSDTPLRNLKNRFAKGEITAKEYHQIKKEL